MTALKAELLRQIRATGPMTVAEYMAICLTHPRHGYYTTRDALGRDFITSPEISQMFGELLGLSLAAHWQESGSPSDILLAEAGPGRGTLMADALRAADRVPGFLPARQIHLVEVSEHLRSLQAKALAGHAPIWHATLETLPDRPLFFLANEFFDALPIRQFLRDGGGWRERVIGADGDALVFGLTDPAPLDALTHRLSNTTDGDLVELRPSLAPAVTEVAARIAAHGGAAIVVDYGEDHALGDTFQAVSEGKRTDPLDAPGTADLTAHVDFCAVAQAARAAGAETTAATPQGIVLERLGITERARALAARGDADAVAAAHRRLTHPAEMGHLFRAIAIHPENAPPPPGFVS